MKMVYFYSLTHPSVGQKPNRPTALARAMLAGEHQTAGSGRYLEKEAVTDMTLFPWLSTALLLSASLTFSTSRPADATPEQQREVLTYLNEARARPCRCGRRLYPAVPPLTLNPKLNAASDKFAVDMSVHNFFNHQGRDRSKPWERMEREGYRWQATGENIAAGPLTARTVVDGWLKSEGHCQNIMSPDFQEVGVGFAQASRGRYRTYWVTDFGTRR